MPARNVSTPADSKRLWSDPTGAESREHGRRAVDRDMHPCTSEAGERNDADRRKRGNE